MKRRTLLAGSTVFAALPLAGLSVPARAQGAKTKLVWWHAMTGALNDQVNRICTEFNASQSTYDVEPIYKGTYPETMTAVIAAWRANQAPHLVQVFEVGTGSMLAAGPATKQIWQLAKETGVKIDPNAYIPAVRGYYSLADGRMASMPFNSSTAIMWINKDAFAAAGLDPAKPPATYDELRKAASTLKAKIDADKAKMGGVEMAMTTSWFPWVQMEEFAAIHDLPYATEADGFNGLGAKLEINAPHMVAQVQRFLDMGKEGSFVYTGRDSKPDPTFYAGKAAIMFGSSSSRGDIARNAKFAWAPAFLPYDPAIKKEPINSIIGGASLWVMTAKGRSEAEYKGTAELLAFLGTPEQDAKWHQATGYVPVTTGGYELSKKQGYYEKQPGADLPIQQLARGKVTNNSRGLRLGRLPEIRNIIYEEVEKAMQGQQDAKTAMANAEERGNKVLREFQKSVG